MAAAAALTSEEKTPPSSDTPLSFKLQVSIVVRSLCRQWSEQYNAEMMAGESDSEDEEEDPTSLTVKLIPNYLQSIILSYFSFADILLAYTHSLRLMDLIGKNTVSTRGVSLLEHLKSDHRVIHYPESGIHQRFSLLSTSTAHHKRQSIHEESNPIRTLKDSIYFFGGYDKARSMAVSDTRMYSLSDGQWRRLSPMNHARYESRALLLSDHSRTMESLLGKDTIEYAVVVGGYSTYAVPHCELYDLRSDQWFDLPQTPLQIAEFAAGSSGYRVFTAGGTDSHSVLNECLMLDVFELIYDLPDESERMDIALKSISKSSAGDLSALSDADITTMDVDCADITGGLKSLLRAKSVKSVDRIIEDYRCTKTAICGDYLLPATDGTGQGSGTEKLTMLRNPDNVVDGGHHIHPRVESKDDEDLEIDLDLDTDEHPASKQRLWQKLPSLNRHNYGLTGLVTQGGSRVTPNQFFVFGGHRAYRRCECLDLSQGSHFITLPKCRYDHYNPALFESPSGCLCVSGDNLKVHRVEVYDPRAGQWINDDSLHVWPDFQPEKNQLRTFYPI